MSQSAGSGLASTASVTGQTSADCAAAGVANTPKTAAAMQDEALSMFASLSSSVRARSIRPPGPLDCRSPHQPTLRRREIRARMGRAAVVPQEEVADAPDMLVDKFLLLGVVEHGVEQRAALFPRHVDDADSHQPVDVDRLAVGVLVSAEHRVDALAARLGAFAVALQG